jgi:Domain of unknown function (DUF4183)
MATTSLSPTPKLQFFDLNGAPLAGGLLYTYAAGTTTPLATYTDSSGNTANTNPIVLDSRGEANVWLSAAIYKFALYTSASVLIWTVDNINGSTFGVEADGDGTTTAFAVVNGFTAIYINGVYQNRNTYVVTSGTVTFTEAPPNTSTIEVVYN